MKTALRFRGDGSFLIAQFTDMHGISEEQFDGRTRRFIRQVLESEQPDLIVVTGDAIHKLQRGTLDPMNAFVEVLQPIASSGIPWAFVYGNHEWQSGLDPCQLNELLLRLPGSLYKIGPSDVAGSSNYTLSVRGSHTDSPAAMLYMFDSGAKAPQPPGGSAWIRRSQIDWYVRMSKAATANNGGSPLPSVAFLHTPLPEYRDVWQAGDCEGSCPKGIGCPSINSGLFAAMVGMRDVRGVFAGHDHYNDFCGDWHGIRLCCTRMCGFHGSTPPGFLRGARMIRLKEGQPQFETWQRLENEFLALV